jgi:hypothetical protein
VTRAERRVMARNTHAHARRAAWVAAHLLSAAPAAAQHGSALEAALHFFTRNDAAGIVERFDSLRPAPVSAGERDVVLATLPPEGEVRRLDPAQRGKLDAARRVLELHGRETVYVIKVIDVPQAAVALHARGRAGLGASARSARGRESIANVGTACENTSDSQFGWRGRRFSVRRFLVFAKMLC